MKPRAAILRPDLRFKNMAAGFHRNGVPRMMAITDLYDQMEEIRLDPLVPADVMEEFDKAKHAYVYWWFAYELVSLAEQQGYQTLELALREKLSLDERQKADRHHWGLEKLFGRALAHKWLPPERFFPGTRMTIYDFILKCRNMLAHGSRHLFPVGSIEMLKLCAEILNSLYKR